MSSVRAKINRRTLWLVDLSHNLIDIYNKCQKPITVIQIFDTYINNNYGKKKWSYEFINKIIGKLELIGLFHIFRLATPDSQSYFLFPGKHQVSSTVFLVPNTVDHNIALEQCNAYMKELVEQSLVHREDTVQKAIIKKRQYQKNLYKFKNNKLTDDERALFSSSIFVVHNKIRNGYYKKKIICASMLHIFLFTTFYFDRFTLSDALNKMNLDLLMKILGLESIPDVICEEPMLKFIILSSYPQDFIDTLDIEDLNYRLEDLFDYLIHYNLLKLDNSRYYQLSNSRVIFNLGVATIGFSLTSINDICDFWKFLHLYDLISNKSCAKSVLLEKKYSFEKHFFLSNSLQNIFSKLGVIRSYNYLERFGFDRFFILKYSKDLSIDDINFSKFKSLLNQTLNLSNIDFNDNVNEDVHTIDELANLIALSYIYNSVYIIPYHQDWDIIKDKIILSNNSIRDRDTVFFEKLHDNRIYFDLFYKKSFQYKIGTNILKNLKSRCPSHLNTSAKGVSYILDYFLVNCQALKISSKIGVTAEILKRYFIYFHSGVDSHTLNSIFVHLNPKFFHECLLHLYQVNFLELSNKTCCYKRNGNRDFKQKYLTPVIFDNIKKISTYLSSDDNIIFYSKLSSSLLYFILERNILKSSFYIIDRNIIDIKIERQYYSLFDLPETSTRFDKIDLFKPSNPLEYSISKVLNEGFELINKLLKDERKCINLMLIYNTIIHSCEHSISLSNIIERSKTNLSKLEIIDNISLLINLGLVFQMSSILIEPFFISSWFYKSNPSVYGHIYTDIYGKFNNILAKKYSRLILELIWKNPGIELIEIYKKLSYVSIKDLLHILNILECDNSIYSLTLRKDTDLFHTTYVPASKNDIHIQHIVYLDLTTSDERDLFIHYYSTICPITNSTNFST